MFRDFHNYSPLSQPNPTVSVFCVAFVLFICSAIVFVVVFLASTGNVVVVFCAVVVFLMLLGVIVSTFK